MTSEHLVHLLRVGDLTPEGAESYAAGMIEGIVGCLDAHCGRDVAIGTLLAAVGHIPSLESTLEAEIARRRGRPDRAARPADEGAGP